MLGLSRPVLWQCARKGGQQCSRWWSSSVPRLRGFLCCGYTAFYKSHRKPWKRACRATPFSVLACFLTSCVPLVKARCLGLSFLFCQTTSTDFGELDLKCSGFPLLGPWTWCVCSLSGCMYYSVGFPLEGRGARMPLGGLFTWTIQFCSWHSRTQCMDCANSTERTFPLREE